MFAATLLASLALVVGQAPEEPALILRGNPPVSSAVFSHDSKRLAVAAQDLEVYDVATGKLTLRIPHVFGDVSFSPDGRWLCSVHSVMGMISVRGTARLYDAETGKLGHAFNATAAAFSSDGRWLVLEGERPLFRNEPVPPPMIGDVATGKTHPAELPAIHRDGSQASYVFSKDGKQFAPLRSIVAKKPDEWTAYDLATGKKNDDAKNFAVDPADLLLISPPSGTRAFIASGFSLVDLDNGKTLHSHQPSKTPGEAYCVEAHTVRADRHRLYLTMAQEKKNGVTTHLACVDLDKAGAVRRVLELDTAPAFDDYAYSEGVPPLAKAVRKKGGRAERKPATVRIDPTGRVAASIDSAGVLTLWNLATGKATHRLRDTGHRDSVSLLSFRHDSKVLATGNHNEPVLLWDLATGRQLAALAPHPTLLSLAFRPNSDQLVGSGWGGAQTWDTHAKQVVRTFPSEHAGHFAFTPDGKRLAVSLSDHEVAILDADTGKRVGGIVAKREGSPKPPQRRFILALHYTPDGKQLAFSEFDGAIRFHDPDSGKALHVAWSQGNDQLSDFQFSADGAKLLVQSSHSSLQLFDAKTGKWIVNVVESKQRFHFALHPDGKRVALGYLDGSVKEIDLATQKTLRTLAGHHRPVAMLAYSPDGRLLASAGWDCDVRVWNVPAK